jgi:hypothetical protein
MFWSLLDIQNFIFSPYKNFLQTLVPLNFLFSILVPAFFKKFRDNVLNDFFLKLYHY